MIRYALRCRAGHEFESWFHSAEGFDGLRRDGHVCCPVCGTSEVEKALMTPQLRPARRAAPVPEGAAVPQPDTGGPLSTPQGAGERAIARLRKRIEEQSEYVGLSFATEARRIHSGESPERTIHGEARIDDAKALIEEGVPVAPLPFLPARKAN